MPPSIWWIRRDLRLADNPALAAAMAHGGLVVPVYVLDPTLLYSTGSHRAAFLLAGLDDLAARLSDLGTRLVVRHGPPLDILPGLVAETGATGVFAQADATPYARRRDQAIAQRVTLTLTQGLTVHPPGQVVKPDRRPYHVFGAFMRAWLALPLPGSDEVLDPPTRLEAVPPIASLDATEIQRSIPQAAAGHRGFTAGEEAGRARLKRFCGTSVHQYAGTRDRLDTEGTSQLSPYIHLGMVSPRAAVVAVAAARATALDAAPRASADKWLAEIAWREFFVHLIWHYPALAHKSFRREGLHVAWRNCPEEVAAWKAGQTGYPVVDAAMRQLAAEGWIPNRARMIAASFLTKHLLIDWRIGEAHFRHWLVDGDLAANNGGWQWVAGTGVDAAPYFRVFNPVSQGAAHDPNGDYVRRWIPEIGHVPTRHVHAPWRMTELEQAAARCVIGRDYPPPLVDHPTARSRALQAFRRAADLARAGRVAPVVAGVGLTLAAAAGVAGCSSVNDPLVVASAVNFAPTAHALAEAFTRSTGTDVAIATGSTGQLAAQVRAGAPFHVLLAADETRPEELAAEGLADPDTLQIYALGRLAFVRSLGAAVTGPEGLATVASLAIADPIQAPYGAAARSYLVGRGLWDDLEDRLVFGQDVGQALAIVETGAVEGAIVALALVQDFAPERVWPLPESTHAPLRQGAIALYTSGSVDARAVDFLSFLRGQAARRIIAADGYGLATTGEED